jgi:hypothetical protein
MAVDDFVSGRASVLRSLRYTFSLKYLLLYASSYFLGARHIVAIISRMES